ncbi:hypothetical protein C8R47DRAFT_33448 [Mycena vitilis]|nr:hypothetical protein C8R47DRAFT_33448 [Mycena vitilis]
MPWKGVLSTWSPHVAAWSGSPAGHSDFSSGTASPKLPATFFGIPIYMATILVALATWGTSAILSDACFDLLPGEDSYLVLLALNASRSPPERHLCRR